MHVSSRWLNDYIDPPASPEDQADLLTRAGFPLEGRADVPGGDVQLDFEMTSNRGDCVCHLGLAREITALSDRVLKPPSPTFRATGPAASGIVSVTNREPARCPLYTARVIRGVTVGTSPDWLRERLEARGDIPRNNVVDATNFVLFEMGQPTHVFDLDKLAGPEIIIRMARSGEPFLPIGEGSEQVKLTADDLVIADAENAVAIAGVKGGALSAVTDATTNVLIEAATFDPVAVRNTSRRHNIASDSSYRFERGVHPGQIEEAADRLVGLILELCGGELCEGVVADGAPIPERRTVSMRTARCRRILGVELSDDRMCDALRRLGFSPKIQGDSIDCIVPLTRLDVEREVDLIEEVGRVFGLDDIPVSETVEVRVAPPQPTQQARRAVSTLLAGAGFVEAVNHSLISETAAAEFQRPGTTLLRLAERRAVGEPALRPSVLPSLLRVRAHNRDNGVESLALFESAATYWLEGDKNHERVVVGLLADGGESDDGLRPIRGVIERLAELLTGSSAGLTCEASNEHPWLSVGASVSLDGKPLGWMGVIAAPISGRYGLDGTVIGAELALPDLYAEYPPVVQIHALPEFPAITRDLSVVLAETTTWADIVAAIEGLSLEHLEAVEYVTVYRGKPIPAGRKSLTLRLRFRAEDRTLVHEEVDVQMERAIATLQSAFGAEVRG